MDFKAVDLFLVETACHKHNHFSHAIQCAEWPSLSLSSSSARAFAGSARFSSSASRDLLCRRLQSFWRVQQKEKAGPQRVAHVVPACAGRFSMPAKGSWVRNGLAGRNAAARQRAGKMVHCVMFSGAGRSSSICSLEAARGAGFCQIAHSCAGTRLPCHGQDAPSLQESATG